MSQRTSRVSHFFNECLPFLFELIYWELASHPDTRQLGICCCPPHSHCVYLSLGEVCCLSPGFKCGRSRPDVGSCLSVQTESISAQGCFTSRRLSAVCSAAGNLFTGPPKTFLLPPPHTPRSRHSSSLLQTVFYNVVWSPSWGTATSNSLQPSPPQPPHATLIPRRPPSRRRMMCRAWGSFEPTAFIFPLRRKCALLCRLQAYWIHLSIPSTHILDTHSFEQSVTSWLRLSLAATEGKVYC